MAKWYDDTGFQGDIVLSTRVRLARNLKGIPFPNKMSDDDAKKVVELVSGALENMNYGFTRLDLNAMFKTEKQKLVEKRYISPDLAKQTKPCAVFISDDESVSIMVNEEEHIRMQSIFAGLECQKAYDIISKIDAYLAEKLEYAVHPKYGYLTSCLTNLGTGMRVSCMLHLPAVCLCSVADSMFATLGKLGITVRGMYGEGSKASGYLFQISNQMTLGVDEKEIIDKINDVVNQVIAKERELRGVLLKQRGVAMEDKIMRSCAILKGARLLSSSEMLSLFSNARLAMSLGLVNGIEPRTLNSLMVETSPASLADCGSVTQRDAERAKIVRERLKKEE